MIPDYARGLGQWDNGRKMPRLSGWEGGRPRLRIDDGTSCVRMCVFMRACMMTLARDGDHDKRTGISDLFPLVTSLILLLQCLPHFRHNVHLIISFLHLLSQRRRIRRSTWTGL
jgi:hypothetical protein